MGRGSFLTVVKCGQETKYWLRMLAQAEPEKKDELKVLWKECQELTLIFNKISSSLKETVKH